MQKKLSPDFFYLLLAVLVALAFRLDFLVANNFVIDSDEAIVGLMARHINAGNPIPVFYYGQPYMGTFEPLVAAGVFRLFGECNVTLKSVPLFFSLLLVVAVFALVKEAVGVVAARIAAFLMAIPPSALLIWSAMARGGFIEISLIGTLSFLAGVKWLKYESPPLSLTAITGMLLGLGWWTNNQIIFFALPLAFFMGSHLLWNGDRLRPLRTGWGSWLRLLAAHAVIAAAAFFVGSLPFWVYNFSHEFASFGMLTYAHKKDLPEHFSGAIGVALPILFGARRFWGDEELFSGSTLLAWCLYGILLAFVLIKRRNQLGRLFLLRVDARRPVELFLGFIFAAVAIFVLSSFGFLYQAPRYLLPLYVGIFALLGFVVQELWPQSRCLAMIPVIAAFGFSLASSYLHGRAIPGEPFVFKGERVSKDHGELIAWLDQNRFGWIRTNYWIGYRLAFETGERIRFLVNQEPYTRRIKKYDEEGSKLDSASMPLVLVPAQAAIIKEALGILGYHWEERILSGYTVLYHIRPRWTDLHRVPGSEFAVKASQHGQEAYRAVDGDAATRWGSGEPQKPGMWFEADLRRPRTLRGIEYDLANWTHDYPREFTMELVLPSGEHRRLFEPESWGSIRYFLKTGSKVTLLFDPAPVEKVVLHQLGSDQVFDWSIAELRLLE